MDRRRFLALCGASAALAGCAAESGDGTGRTDTDSGTTQGVQSPPVAPLDGTWESYRHDAGNAAATDDPGPRDRPTERWRYATAAGELGAPPAAAGDAFVVVTEDGTMYARGASDGTVRWRRSLEGTPEAGPVASDGTVVVAAAGALAGFRVDSGETRWTVAFPGPVVGLASAGGRVVVATDAELAAFSLADGSERWRHPVDASVATPPTTTDAVTAVGLDSGDTLAVGADGTTRWRTAVRGTPTFPPALAHGQVYHGTADHLVAVDAATGDQRWAHGTTFPVATPPVPNADAVFLGTVDTDPAGTPAGTPRPTDVMPLAAALVAVTPDGGERWRITSRGTYNFTSGPPEALPLVATAEYVAFGPGETLVAHDAATGKRRWSAPVGGVPLAVADGVVTTGTTGIAAATGAVAWRFRDGGGISKPPAVVGNTVYVGSDDHTLYALAADAGTVEWTARTNGPIRASPAVGDDAVYVGTMEGTLYAFDRADGTVLWRTPVGGRLHSPVLADGTVYVGNFSRSVHAVDAADGTERWRTAVDGERFVALTLAAADGAVYGGANGDLRAFDAADGTERWGITYGDRSRVQSPPAVADGRVVVNVGDSLRVLDAADGTERWSRSTGGSTHPPVVDGAKIYVPGDGAVHAFAGDGRTRWRTDVGEDLMLAAGADALYGVGFDSPLLAFDPADGSERWRYDEHDVTTAPALAGAYLFAGDETGTVRALGPDPG